MYVCGYTRETKDLVLCEFTADEILGYGIDPLRLDLCDEPGSIPLVREGEEVLFAPMGKWMIGRVRGNKAEIAMCEGSKRSVLRGKWVEGILRDLGPSRTSFEDVFVSYARSAEEWHYRQKSRTGAEEILLLDGETVVLHGASVRPLSRPGNMCFGKMFEWLPFPADTSGLFDWILETFAQWDPVIYGRAVYNAYKGQEFTYLDVTVKNPSMDEVRSLCDRLDLTDVQWYCKEDDGIEGLKCVRDGVKIEIWERQKRDFYEGLTWLTPDMMECSASGWFNIRRIAAFDIARSKYRILRGTWDFMRGGPGSIGAETEQETESWCPGLEFIQPEPLTGVWRVDGN
jgi:hypothetical protein